MDSANVNKALELLMYDVTENPHKALLCLDTLSSKVTLKDAYSKIIIGRTKGLIYANLGKFSEALKEYLDAINICERKYLDLRYQLFNSVAQLYSRSKDFKKGFDYIDSSIAYHKSHDSKAMLALNLNNKAIMYEGLQDYNKALEIHLEAIEIRESLGHNLNLAQSYLNISRMYLELGDFKHSIDFAYQSERICDSLKSELGLSYVNGILSQIYYEQKQYAKAEQYALKVLLYAKRTGAFDKLMSSNALLYNIHKDQHHYKEALEYRNAYFSYKDSVFNIDNVKKQTTVEYENKMAITKKEQEQKDLIIQQKEERQEIIFNASLIGLILLGLVVILIYIGYRNKQKAAYLISLQKKEVEFQKELVEEKQKEILDSIHYAKRIQNTLLAHKDFINEHLPQNFICFKPKDIVSGDFYWAIKNGNRFYLAVCDSTGHGVPGAFMSLLNISFLSEAINEKNILEPNEVFNYVRERLIASVSKEGQKDGFDGILVCFDKNSNEVSYAAAHNAPILISNGEITELSKDKMPVGIGEIKEEFTLHKIKMNSGDILYLYTDGYADQFGGPKGKKFKYKQLNDLLLSIHSESLKEQVDSINKRFEEWKGDLEQVDDVCVIGIKL